MSDPQSVPPPSQAMFMMVTGYWVSQAVGTLAALSVPDLLAAGPQTAASLAQSAGCHQDSLFRLLRMCASIGVLQHRDDQFSLTPLGQTLRSDVPGSMRGMAIAQSSPGHWLPWGQFIEAVRTGKRQTPSALGMEIFEHYAAHPAEGKAFTAAMHDLSELVARELARLVDMSDAGRIVDVGGASGNLLASALDANPDAHGVVFDLEQNRPDASALLSKRGLSDRAEFQAGDFFASVPASTDIFLLKQVLHDWNDAECTTILTHCRAGLNPGGKVYIVEMVIPTDGTPSPAAAMDINMLVLLPGRERTSEEFGALLASAGLHLQSVIPTHSPFSILEATHG